MRAFVGLDPIVKLKTALRATVQTVPHQVLGIEAVTFGWLVGRLGNTTAGPHRSPGGTTAPGCVPGWETQCEC